MEENIEHWIREKENNEYQVARIWKDMTKEYFKPGKTTR
jgi:hypothetical protein